MTSSARTWFQRLAPYRNAENGRAVFELLITLAPFLALWAGIWGLMQAGHYWSVIGFIPAGGLLVRLFIIQHDCGHGSMFSHKSANDWVGRFISVMTLTPYDHWRRGHALHHAGSGNLDRRGMGDDITTLTVEEYEAGHIPGAIQIDVQDVPKRIKDLQSFAQQEVGVYCERGFRAQIAETALQEAGFDRIYQLEGDIKAWRQAKFPVETGPGTQL